MRNLVDKVKEGLNSLFPKEEKEELTLSISNNGLDSESFFSFQKQILASTQEEKKLSKFSFKEELELNRLRELINGNQRELVFKELNFNALVSPNYTKLAEKEEIKSAEKEKKEAKKEKEKSWKLQNWEVGEDILKSVLLPKLESAKIDNLLILSDDAYTRQLVGYRKLISLLQTKNISFFEYTNIQPLLNRESIKKIVNFALQNKVNSLLVVGSDSLIDLSRLVIKRLVKPNSISLQSGSKRPVVSSCYSFFALPTLVIPSTKLIEQKTLDGRLFFKKLDLFDSSLYLFNPVNSADFVAYYPPFLLEYSRSKQIEVLHLLFFRLLFSYFNAELDAKEKINLVRGLKSLEWYLNYLSNNNLSLSLIDAKIIMKLAAQALDGRYLMSKNSYWAWYKLAANLSSLTQLEFFKSLALFLPSFLEYIAVKEKEGREKASELSYLLFGSVSAEGLILNLIKYLKKFKLPLKFFDIPTLKGLDSKFVNLLVKRSSPFLVSYKMTKKIIENLAVW